MPATSVLRIYLGVRPISFVASELVRWEKQSASGGGETLYNVVGEPGYWTCSGALLRDGQLTGSLEFTGPVMDGSYGPDLVLKLAAGESVLMHPLAVP